MKKDNTEPELPTPDLLPDEFLKNYYHLFVLVSAFGAIAVYLSSIHERGIYGDKPSSLLDIAVVASLALVVIVSLYINFVFAFSYTKGLITPTAVFSKKNILVTFFLVPFNVLIVVLVVLLARIELTVYFFVSLVSFIGGILVYGAVSPRLFRFFNRRAKSDGYGSFLGFVAFGVYNVLLFAGTLLFVPTIGEQFDGVTDPFVPFAGDYTMAALVYLVFGLGMMPIVMLIGFVLYLLYYKIG